MFISKFSSKARRKEMISQFKILLNSPFVCENSSPLYAAPDLTRILCLRKFGNLGTKNAKAVEISECQQSISVPSNRISRFARNDAQLALFDYLHSTRGFTYTDAEHMSKNSPTFLRNLLSMVNFDDKNQNLSKALSKLFRFCPINEFEPFLESMGLSSSEVASLLPRDLMFLEDDSLLLDNFHVLCDYGIPRTQMGKIYMQAPTVFRYQRGVLLVKLKAYEDLGLSRRTVIKLATSCPLILVGDVNKDLNGILDKVRAVGLESDWIGCYLSSKHTYNLTRMHATLIFLEEIGYVKIEMRDLIRQNPELLFEGSGEKIYGLIGRLLKLGLKMEEVYCLIRKNPEILSPKSVKNLCGVLHFLFEIEMETEYIAKIVSDHLHLLVSYSLEGPRSILSTFNGDRQRLAEVIKENPVKLFSLASKPAVNGTKGIYSQNPSSHLDRTRFLLKLGYPENSDELTKALKKFRGRGDQLQERFDCLVQAGLDCNIVTDMIKQAPAVLNQSKEVLEKKIYFLKSSGYSVESIVKFPSYLGYDMKRIQRRLSMYLWLRQNGLAKPMVSLSTLLACADSRFMKFFVDIHPEGPAKWEDLRKS